MKCVFCHASLSLGAVVDHAGIHGWVHRVHRNCMREYYEFTGKTKCVYLCQKNFPIRSLFSWSGRIKRFSIHAIVAGASGGLAAAVGAATGAAVEGPSIAGAAMVRKIKTKMEIGAIAIAALGIDAAAAIVGMTTGKEAEGAAIGLGAAAAGIGGIAAGAVVIEAAKKFQRIDRNAISFGMCCGALAACVFASTIPAAISTIAFVGGTIAGVRSIF